MAVQMNKICDGSVENIYVVILRVIQIRKQKGWKRGSGEKRTLKFCSGSRTSSTAVDGCLITHTTTDDALERLTKGTSNRMTGGSTNLSTCLMITFK